MKGAPACRIEVGVCRAWQVFVLTAASLAIGATVAWWTSRLAGPSGDAPLPTVLALTLVVASAVLALQLWRSPRGLLAFEGGVWSWSPASRPAEATAVELSVQVDLGGFALVRLRAVDPARGRRMAAVWLPLSRGDDAARWHALRCAFFAGRPSGPAGTAAVPG